MSKYYSSVESDRLTSAILFVLAGSAVLSAAFGYLSLKVIKENRELLIQLQLLSATTLQQTKDVEAIVIELQKKPYIKEIETEVVEHNEITVYNKYCQGGIVSIANCGDEEE